MRYEYRTKLQLVHAVNGVNCVFEPGKVYAVVGASGSGKTTFLSLLAGLDVPAGGAITLDGKSTAELDRDAYRLEHVSVIYQNYNLFYHLTVLENAAYPLYVKKIATKHADAVARRTLLRVGLTEEQCKAKGLDYKVGKFPMSANGKALIINGGEGLVKIISDAKYGEVLGMHIIGPRATDLISEGALAIRLEATVDELISTIHSHPTVTETIREAALNAMGRAIHTKN